MTVEMERKMLLERSAAVPPSVDDVSLVKPKATGPASLSYSRVKVEEKDRIEWIESDETKEESLDESEHMSVVQVGVM